MANTREPTGSAFESRGTFFIRITTAPKTRVPKVAPWCTSLDDAHARATAVQKLVNRLRAVAATEFIAGLVDAGATADAEKMAALERFVDGVALKEIETVPVGESSDRPMTFERFAKQWTDGELHRLHPDHVRDKDHADDKSRLTKYVNPVIGPRLLSSIELADADRVMSKLPRELEPGTRRHIAQALGRVLKLAVYPGGHIKASPIPVGWLPHKGKPKARGYVYPDEDATLLACQARDESGALLVPLWRRLLWGFIAREGTRGPSEALSFRWRHVDLVRGAVRLDTNKTDDPRAWALDPGVVRALLAWKEVTPGGTEPQDLIFVAAGGVQPHETTLAGQLRDDLKAAKVTRAELFEHSAHRLQLRAHDLRASFITVALANGRSETWVTDRTGHTTSGQLMNYRRAARTVAELELGSFQPLDEAIPELAPGRLAATKLAAQVAASEFRRRDSNSDKRIQNPLSCH